MTSSNTLNGQRVLRLGVLGAAAIAPSAVVVPARGHSRVEVTTVAARHQGRAREFADRHRIPRVAADYQSMLDDPDVDAVYIPTPNGLHGRWTLAAIEAGNHVLCEKPFTANAEEARSVAAAAAMHPELVVMEAFHWRYHPMATQVLDFISSGRLGRIEAASGSFCVPHADRDDIRWDERLAGGALMDLGCYPLHMLRTFLGAEPTVLRAVAKQRAGVDRSMSAQLSFDGVPATLTCSMWSHRVLSIFVTLKGSNGTLKLLNPVLPQMYGSLLFTPKNSRGERVFIRADRSTSYSHQMDAFVAAVLDARSYPTTAEDAVRTMSIIDDIYLAAGMAIRQPTPIAMSDFR